MNVQQPELKPFLSLENECNISAVCYDHTHNSFWIATDKGLFSYSLSNKKLENVATENLFKQISYMQLDDAQRLWINASNVLFSYHIPDKKNNDMG